MRLLPLAVAVAAVVALALGSGALASPSASAGPSLAARFAPRAYVTGGQEVPVVAKKDMLALRTTLTPADVARVVEDAIEKLGANIRIARVTQLRSEPGTELVSLE